MTRNKWLTTSHFLSGSQFVTKYNSEPQEEHLGIYKPGWAGFIGHLPQKTAPAIPQPAQPFYGGTSTWTLLIPPTVAKQLSELPDQPEVGGGWKKQKHICILFYRKGTHLKKKNRSQVMG